MSRKINKRQKIDDDKIKGVKDFKKKQIYQKVRIKNKR